MLKKLRNVLQGGAAPAASAAAAAPDRSREEAQALISAGNAVEDSGSVAQARTRTFAPRPVDAICPRPTSILASHRKLWVMFELPPGLTGGCWRWEPTTRWVPTTSVKLEFILGAGPRLPKPCFGAARSRASRISHECGRRLRMRWRRLAVLRGDAFSTLDHAAVRLQVDAPGGPLAGGQRSWPGSVEWTRRRRPQRMRRRSSA